MADTETIEKSPEAKKQQGWMSELRRAVKWRKTYLDRCEVILKRYEDERDEDTSKAGKDRYNIFWANIETIKPLCYTKVPPAQVLRRYPNDPDAIARIVAEVMERAINFSNDCYDFDAVLKQVRDGHLLLAEGTEWIRYVPTIEAVSTPGVDQQEPEADKKGILAKGVDAVKGALGMGDKPAEAAAPDEKLVYEEVISDYVNYQDWGTNKCRNWEEVRFVYRACYLNRAALIKHFGEVKGKACNLNHKPPESDKTVSAEERDKYSLALVYEVWDKPSRTVIHVSEGYADGLLKETRDPLELKHFWPFPKPAYGTLSPRALVGIPDYAQYQDLCKELDRHTERIGLLTKALRMIGIYAGESKHTLQQIFDGKDSTNAMIPVDDWAMWADKGGMKGVVEWVPIDKVAQVLGELYKARELTIAAIYQICGIPDIMRGDTESEETAAAQNLKSTWGSSRMSEKQKEMARFCRDDYRIKGEIIAKKFSIKTIAAMTGYPLLTAEEKQAAQRYIEMVETQKKLFEQQQAMQQQPQQPGMPAAPPQQQMQPPPPPPPPLPPEKMALVDKPTWEEIDAYMKSDAMRLFRIDIEANSTVEPDMIAARRDASEFATAFGKLIGESFEIVKAAPPFGKVVAAAARYLCTKYEMGREMEEVIEKALTEIAATPRQPTEQELAAQQAKGGKSPEEIAVENRKVDAIERATDVKAQEVQAKSQVDMAAVQADAQNSAADAQTNAMHAQNEARRIDMEAQMAAMQQRLDQMATLIESMTRSKEAKIDAETRVYEADKDVEAAEKSKPAPSAAQ